MIVRRRMMIAVAMSVVASTAHGQAKMAPRPVPGPDRTPVIPALSVTTLRNGLRLAVVENHTLPLVAVRFGLAGGPLVDPAGKEGAWVLMTSQMREGTTTRTAAVLGDASAEIATPIGWSNSQGIQGSPTFTTVTSAWTTALDLAADMLQHPSFPPEAMARAQNVQAASAARLTQTATAFRQANSLLYGADHPFARTATEASIRAVTHDDIVAMHDAYIGPQNTALVVVGDVTPAAARAAVERAFGGWARSSRTVSTVMPAVAARTEQTTIYLRDDPGAPVATVYTAIAMPSRESAGAAAAEAVETILGGSRRALQAFRVDRGLSYSPQTIAAWRPEPQPAVWYGNMASVTSARADSSVVEWLKVLSGPETTRPFTPDDLDFARRSLVGALPGQIGTISTQANTALALVQNRWPAAFYTDYIKRVNALTLDDLQKAAAKYVDANHMAIVVVGDRARIEAPLRATGIPVVIVP